MEPANKFYALISSTICQLSVFCYEKLSELLFCGAVSQITKLNKVSQCAADCRINIVLDICNLSHGTIDKL